MVTITAVTSPPERLRAELERHRDRGHSFNAIWAAATSKALRDEPLHVAVFWRSVWAEQRLIWAANYGGPCARKKLFVHDREHALARGGVVIA